MNMIESWIILLITYAVVYMVSGAKWILWVLTFLDLGILIYGLMHLGG